MTVSIIEKSSYSNSSCVCENCYIRLSYELQDVKEIYTQGLSVTCLGVRTIICPECKRKVILIG